MNLLSLFLWLICSVNLLSELTEEIYSVNLVRKSQEIYTVNLLSALTKEIYSLCPLHPLNAVNLLSEFTL